MINTNEVGGGTISTSGEENRVEMDKMFSIRGRSFLEQASEKTCRPEIKAEVPLPRIRCRMGRDRSKLNREITHTVAQVSPVLTLVRCGNVKEKILAYLIRCEVFRGEDTGDSGCCFQ